MQMMQITGVYMNKLKKINKIKRIAELMIKLENATMMRDVASASVILAEIRIVQAASTNE